MPMSEEMDGLNRIGSATYLSMILVAVLYMVLSIDQLAAAQFTQMLHDFVD